MIDFMLPSLGADMDKGKLIQWKVAPGDVVKRGQIVAVIETSKAAVEIEVWHDGTISELLVEPGSTVPVGTPLATLIEQGEAAATKPAAHAASKTDLAAVTPAPTAPPMPAKGNVAPANTIRRRVSPAARKHAAGAGIDINIVAGTGPDGAVTLKDVDHAFAATGVAAIASAFTLTPPPTAAPEVAASTASAVKHDEMRRAIAVAMSRSKREIPHYYLSETVNMQRAQRWLKATNEQRAITERVLMTALQLKAVALALKQFTDMNGFYLDGTFKPAEGINVGVAISLRQGGLIAPAIRDAADKPLSQVMRELMDLVKRTRVGTLRGSEVSGQTITITNLGEQGVEAVHGVIYPPQVALVGFGRIAERPWAESGGLFAMPLMTTSLAGDHRVSDGHRGGLFLAAIRDLLQKPEEL